MYMMESNKRAVPPNIFLPPGFRFHPTDDELIAFYLMKKVVNNKFSAHAIADVDLNKFEPWELPERANMGEKEWYFFSLRDRKYPTGMRTNRATEAGYWKATGKDRDIRGSHLSGNHNALVGMKKTLVFYRGRAPRGEKTNWVMHEYRLEGQTAHLYGSRAAKEEWVVCRIFQKKALAGKRLTSAPGEDGQDSDVPSSPAATEHYEKSEFDMEGTNDHMSCITTFDNNSNNKEAQASSNNIWKTSFASSGIYSGDLAKLSPLFDPEFLPALNSSSHRTTSVNNHMFPKAIDNSFKGGLKSCKSEPFVNDNNNYKVMETLTGILGESLSYETLLQQQQQQPQQQQQQQQQQQGQICGIPTDQSLNEMLFSRYLADPSSSELDHLYAY